MKKTVVVKAGAICLALGLPERGMPEILGFGRGALAPEFWPDVPRSSRVNGMDVDVPSNVLLPVGGLGFFGWPAICGHRDGRMFTLEFQNWQTEEIDAGIILKTEDPVAEIGLQICLNGGATGVLSISTSLINRGSSDYTLDRCMAASFLMPAGASELTSFTGMWGREFQTRQSQLPNGLWMQESRRGRTSHDRFPIIFLECGGERMGFHLGWSGNHQMAIDTLDDGRRLVHLGELFEPGEMRLAPGEAYDSPTAFAGPDSEAFHAFVRESVIAWPGGEMKPRPVTLNTWEGNYFDHRMESLKAQADAAAAVGIERFVLDDGWFGKRDDDTTSLGDWFIDARKYPNGLKPLVDHVTSLGMEFGLWFEPENVNPESELFRAHPDWALQVEGRPLLLSRNQLVLDLTRPEVSDYLFQRMEAVLSQHAIAYIKWDMNRDLTHAGGTDGRARTARQTRAVYALMNRVRQAFPAVEIESCASGGGRIDYGVLRYTHRVWTSDCTDAFERLEIQHGASQFVSPELLGAHIAASPNHQTGRKLSLAFRALVALAYHLGVELNPLTLDAEEKQELERWIALHKSLRPLLHAAGKQFRLPPLDGRYVWGAADTDRIVAFVVQGPQMAGEQPAPVRLPVSGDSDVLWRVAAVHPVEPEFIRISEGQQKLLNGELTFSLDTLRHVGLPLPMLKPESGLLLEFQPVKGG
ncbi:alpha-galactosidase [Rhizobium sp. CNPSo 3464]|uniref:alpha-galactosidase n=1 Tax=Rhizobium sp. CNPSo 3464 TaxID=3021406 RepID=UPI00254AAF83|nr:alpha-galactosidase [Rhizobium sp. CNPSo 3464]MDK4740446.1 alpha-galactosidase [Rhizobium sp. CNPSo 3464]